MAQPLLLESGSSGDLLAGHSEMWLIVGVEWASREKKKCLAATKLNSLVSSQSCAVASFPRQESVMNVKPACTDPSWGALRMHCTGKVFTSLSSGHCPAWFSSSRWSSHKNSFCWISPNKPDSFVAGWGRQRLSVCFAWTKRVQNGRNYRFLWMLLLRGSFLSLSNASNVKVLSLLHLPGWNEAPLWMSVWGCSWTPHTPCHAYMQVKGFWSWDRTRESLLFIVCAAWPVDC